MYITWHGLQIILTCLRWRFDISIGVSGIPATSIVGTASLTNLRFMLKLVEMALFLVKHASSKCAEHKTEEADGVKPGRCFLTNLTHSCLLFECFASLGKTCIDTPGVNCEFVQLSRLGAPATQNLPPCCREEPLEVDAIFILCDLCVIVMTSQREILHSSIFAS